MGDARSSAAASAAILVARLRAAGCVFAEEEADLVIAEAAAREPGEDAGAAAARSRVVAQLASARIAGTPLEVVLGWVGFAGRRIVVRPGVFVPRRRTERLAAAAVAAVRATAHGGAGAVVVDLCCGSGAIGAIIADEVRGVILHAADIDRAAVACARENLDPRGGSVHRGDLLSALPVSIRGRVDVLVANVPYVPRDHLPLLPPEARLHEPLATRDGGSDGLDVLRRVARGSGAWLAPGGFVLMEVAAEQCAEALDVLRSAGLLAATAETARGDDRDDGTCVIRGRRSGGQGGDPALGL